VRRREARVPALLTGRDGRWVATVSADGTDTEVYHTRVSAGRNITERVRSRAHTLTCPFFQLRRGAGAGAAVGFSPAPWRFRHTEHSSPETVSAERVDTHINMMDASLSQRGASHGDIHAWVYLSVYLSMCVCVSLGY
jgi:hypothetical protein